MSAAARRASRDATLLSWAAALGAVTAPALALREQCSHDSARAWLSGASRRGLMRRWQPLTEAPSLYTLTRGGIRAAALTGVAPARVSAASARHAIACCAVAVTLERAFAEHRVLGEQALRRESGRWVDGLGPPVHRPDLLLVPHAVGQLPVAVEVELTVKAALRLEQICRGWARSRAVSGVLYVTAPAVHAPLRSAIAASGAEDRVVALPLAALAGGAAIV
jgi:hypothetical protein